MQARRRIAFDASAAIRERLQMHQFFPTMASDALHSSNNMQETMFLVPSGNLLGLKRRRPGVQEVSWLLWTGVFRGAAPVAQRRLPCHHDLSAKRRPAAWLRGSLRRIARAIDAPRAAAA